MSTYLYLMRTLNFIILLLASTTLSAISTVYNLRIAETTRHQAQRVAAASEVSSIVAATFVDNVRRTYNDIHYHVNSGIATFFFSPGSWYVRGDAAVGHVHIRFPVPVDVRANITQIDDILLMGGYHWSTSEMSATLSGLLGIPTHKDVGLLGAEFGTGHVGVGMQLDGSYAYKQDGEAALMGAARYVRFLSRTACACIQDILVPYDVSLGNLIDVLFAHCNFWGNHQFEVGYNATFAFKSHITPALPNFADETEFMRSNFYVSYRYLFSIEGHGSGLTIGLSYGFDHRPQNFGLKYSATGWLGFGINF
jgi:hypothetical protein